MIMSLSVKFDVAQARINVHPDKIHRQLSSSRLANGRLHAYHSVIAMSLLHPALLILTLFIVLRLRSMKVTMKFSVCATTKYSSLSSEEADPGSKDVAEATGPTLAEEMTVVMLCVFEVVISFLLVVIRQRLLLSGDVESNPGPMGEIEVILYTVDDTTLEEDDWNDVIKECSSLAAKWEQLSGYLGLSIATIDAIKKNFPNNAADCLNEALKHWIKQNYRTVKYGYPSWRMLLEAIARIDKLLFKKLADKHQGNNVPDPNDTDDEMEAGGTSGVPSQGASASAIPTDFKPCLTFPCLNLSEMTKEQKRQLHQRLYAESMDMIQKFQDLFSATTESLKQRKIAVEEIACHLIGLGPSPPAYKNLNLPTFEQKIPELTSAKTVEGAMLVIGKYCSFFNYYMIEHIIKRLGTKQDKKNMEKYKKEFSEYAERHVFECPSEVGTVSEGLTEIFITLDETYESYTVKYLELFVSNLRKILNISSSAVFKLCHVVPGSLKLTFQLHRSIIKDLFPLTREQEAELAKLGVDNLTLIYYQFNRQSQEEATKQETIKKEAIEKSDDSSSIYSNDSDYGTVAGSTFTLSTEQPQVDPLFQDEDGYTPLHRACAGGDIDVVQYLISEMKKHTSLDSIVYNKTKAGITAVDCAVLKGHLPVIKLFITDLNFNPNIPGFRGRPPLVSAAQGGHLEVVKYLTEELHCDPSYAHGEDKVTPLHAASAFGRLNIIRYLTLTRKCSPLPRNFYGNTPLHDAAGYGQYEAVKFFISELKCDPNTPGQWGGIPLHDASQEGHLNIVQYLIDVRKCNPASFDNRKTTPLHLASAKGHLHIVKYLIEDKNCNPLCYDKLHGTPLHWAARFGQLDVIKYFVEVRNCPLNIRNSRNQTPLELAREEGHANIVEYLSSFV